MEGWDRVVEDGSILPGSAEKTMIKSLLTQTCRDAEEDQKTVAFCKLENRFIFLK